MARLWMGISPRSGFTKVLLQDGPGQPLLKARLPAKPVHSQAVQMLCEALALWCGRRVYAAIAADDPDAFFDTTPWLTSWEATLENATCTIKIVPGTRPRPEHDRIDGLGDFRDMRQLLLFEVAE